MVGVAAPPRLLRAYFDALMEAGHTDLGAWGTVFRVGQFVDPPSKLFSPRMVWKGVAQMLRSALAKAGGKERQAAGAKGEEEAQVGEKKADCEGTA